MSLALQSLVALTLLVSGVVATLPLLLAGNGARPDPGAPGSDLAALRVVESPGDRWSLRGEPIPRRSLETLLGSSRPQRLVEYLPSASLGIARVSASLRWLRRINPGGAVIALPPVAQAAAPPPLQPPALPGTDPRGDGRPAATRSRSLSPPPR